MALETDVPCANFTAWKILLSTKIQLKLEVELKKPTGDQLIGPFWLDFLKKLFLFRRKKYTGCGGAKTQLFLLEMPG